MRDFAVGDRVQGPSGAWYVVEKTGDLLVCRCEREGIKAWIGVEAVVARVRANLSVREICNSASKRMADSKREHDKAWAKFREETGGTFRRKVCLDPDKMHGAADEFGGSDY